MRANGTISEITPQWKSEPMLHLPPWGEPTIVLSILGVAMFSTRRRNFQVFGRQKEGYHDSYLDLGHPSDNLLGYNQDNDDDPQVPLLNSQTHFQTCRCRGLTLHGSKSSCFVNHIHSRILQKFPFLVETFYWIISYLFYRMTKAISRAICTGSIIDIAQAHGLAVLELEQTSRLSFLFPIKEHDFQQWFISSHPTALTVLNRAYALIHIPGTVGFIAWYYAVAPTHATFTTVRRTLTLTNLLAFLTFTLYPCMPPRLLPPQHGFLDSVRHDNASSIWMSGNYVNSLAAMPSMHFGYAFVIGGTVLHHAGIFPRTFEPGEPRKGAGAKIFYAVLGVGYPVLVLVAIVATANHYWLDALVAAVVAGLAYLGNRLLVTLLPVERLLLWALRVRKPVPTTGVAGEGD